LSVKFNIMSIEAKHKGIVIATDHFIGQNGEIVLLPEFLANPDVNKHVSGLWVPKSIIDDDLIISGISQVAQGAPARFDKRKMEGLEPPTFRLIYDTSSSGGVPDTLMHLRHIVHYYSAPHMTFTVSLGAFAEVVDATQKYRDYEKRVNGRNIDFLLATAYPENDLEKLKKFTNMDAEEYKAHVSELAEEFELAGVVGAGGLARYTKVGQYYMALGVCDNGADDYTVEVEPWKVKVKKRMISPEETYRYATNTEVQLSRTLFDDGNGNFLYPNFGNHPAHNLNVLSLVTTNFQSVVDRLESLPDPEQLS
jgi:hypothetical protein